jgi:hypothetical protein
MNHNEIMNRASRRRQMAAAETERCRQNVDFARYRWIRILIDGTQPPRKHVDSQVIEPKQITGKVRNK